MRHSLLIVDVAGALVMDLTDTNNLRNRHSHYRIAPTLSTIRVFDADTVVSQTSNAMTFTRFSLWRTWFPAGRSFQQCPVARKGRSFAMFCCVCPPPHVGLTPTSRPCHSNKGLHRPPADYGNNITSNERQKTRSLCRITL